ncbi:MAG: hypothetical protein QOF41_3488 [Methylobacteriaceae bacterium]|nr:hypothetical protein [Methylobacteriaceae bacterium]
MFARRIALLIGFVFAVVASQLPEFAQQYRQRLGGALDELNAQVAGYDASASHSGITRDEGVSRLQKADDRFVQQQGGQMRDTIARRDRLQRQSEGFANAGPVTRLIILAGDFDPTVARGAYQTFEPGIPVTGEGIIAGLVGFLLGGGLTHLAARPLRRRKQAAPIRA